MFRKFSIVATSAMIFTLAVFVTNDSASNTYARGGRGGHGARGHMRGRFAAGSVHRGPFRPGLVNPPVNQQTIPRNNPNKVNWKKPPNIWGQHGVYWMWWVYPPRR
jgi:hypothetical protein